MKYEEIKIGMKVAPISKSIGFGGAGLDRSFTWRQAKKENQPFLFVTGFEKDQYQVILCNNIFHENDGDFFLPEDLIPYEEAQNDSIYS